MKYLLSLFFLCVGIAEGIAQLPDTLQNVLDTTLDRNISQYRNLFDEMASKTVITAEDIYLRGYDNLDELLASVEGVYISHDRTFTQIAMRGISPTPDNNQRVLVLLNNVPLNNPMTGYAPSGYDLRGINMEDIEEVVIIRGASPVTYGNNALTGVIKIKTKTEEKGFRLNFDAGSYGELDGGFSAGYNVGKAKFGLSGRFSQFAGQELYIPSDSIPDQETYNFGGLQFKFELEGLSLNATYLQRNEQMPGLPSASYIAVIDPVTNAPSTSYFHRNQTDDPGNYKGQNLFVDLGFARALNEMHAVDARVFVNYQFSSQELFFHEIETIDTTYIDPNSAYIDYQVDQAEKSLWAGASYQHYLNFNENHQLNAGIQFVGLINAEFGQDATLIRHYDPPTLNTEEPFFPGAVFYLDSLVRKPFENYQQRFPLWSLAFNLQDKYRLNDYLAIQGGLRVELSSITGIQIAPMGQVHVTPWKDKTNISLAYNQGYRLPTILETAVTQSKQSFPNPNLAAEKIHSIELGVKQKLNKSLDLNLAFYHQRLDNLILKEKDQYQNLADSLNTQATGLEAALAFHIKDGIKTYLNYNFMLNKEPMVNAPAQLCKFGVLVPFLTHFYIYTEGQYEGERLRYNGDFTQANFLMNSNFGFRPRFEKASLKWANHIKLAFRMYNIFNEFYQQPVHPDLISTGMMPQNGRMWQTQLTIQF